MANPVDRDAAYQRLLSGLTPALGAAAFSFANTIAAGNPDPWVERYEVAARAVRDYVAEVNGTTVEMEAEAFRRLVTATALAASDSRLPVQTKADLDRIP